MNKLHKDVSCSQCGVRSHSLFAEFNDKEVDVLSEHKSCSYYKKKQAVFLEGSNPRGVFCINKGKVKVFTMGDEGKEQIIHLAKEGEIIGYRSMFSGQPYQVSAETLEECNICFISKENFTSMIDSNSILRNGILSELSKELNERSKTITQMSQKSVRDRLAYSLILLKDIYQDEDINLSREDLANLIGTATETLIRLIKQFKEEGFIEIKGRKIKIVSLSALKTIAGK